MFYYIVHFIFYILYSIRRVDCNIINFVSMSSYNFLYCNDTFTVKSLQMQRNGLHLMRTKIDGRQKTIAFSYLLVHFNFYPRVICKTRQESQLTTLNSLRKGSIHASELRERWSSRRNKLLFPRCACSGCYKHFRYPTLSKLVHCERQVIGS